MEITFGKGAWLGHSLTFRTLSVIMWVFGVLRETLRTITQFITTIVVTDITNIKYLQSKVHESHLSYHCFRSAVYGNLSAITLTYLPIRGTAFEVSGTFLAIRKRNTVWPRRVAIDMVHFWPPAAELKPIFSQSGEVLYWWQQILMTYCKPCGAMPLSCQLHEDLDKNLNDDILENPETVIRIWKCSFPEMAHWVTGFAHTLMRFMWQRSDYPRLGF